MTKEKKHIALEVKDLSIGYLAKRKTFVVFEGINFSIYKGKMVGLVGSNGIGKSTLLRTIAGIQPNLKGNININRNSLDSFTSIQLANELSIVLTEAPTSKNLSVLELVSLGRQPYTNWIGKLSETDKKIIQKALQDTETELLINHKCFELSDGQLQQVLIARALAQDTSLILLDEPTTHLDIYHRTYIFSLLKKIANEDSKTIFFSTHEIDLAIQLSDHLVVMTPQKVYFNSPENLISEGCFDNLFPNETICFEQETKRFVLKN